MARLLCTTAVMPLCVAGIFISTMLLSEQPAHASSTLGCAVQDQFGTLVGYSFVKATDNSVHEFKVTRKVAHTEPYILAEHSYPNLPGWAAGWDNKGFWLVPDANPEYRLQVNKLGPIQQGTRYAIATMWKLVKGKYTFVSTGGCATKGKAWERDAGSPVYPVVANSTPSVPQETMPTMLPSTTSIPSSVSTEDTSIPDPGKLQ